MEKIPQEKISQVNFIRSNKNNAAETFCDNAAHNVAWVSKWEEIETSFASDTQTLLLQQSKEHLTSRLPGVANNVLNINS